MPTPPRRPVCAPRFARTAARGFTLIEVMVTVAIVAILAAIAMPAYSAYIQRAKVPAGLDALQAYFTRMEQRYQDTGGYDNGGSCAIQPLPTPANYSFSCTVSGSGFNSTYIATVTGSGPLAGYEYTINSAGDRATTDHPKGRNTTCWSIRGTQCDA